MVFGFLVLLSRRFGDTGLVSEFRSFLCFRFGILGGVGFIRLYDVMVGVVVL